MKRLSILILAVLALATFAHAQTTYTATIANGEALSTVVNIRANCYPSAVKIPAAWTAADLTFQVSLDGGATFGNRRDEYKGEVTVQVSAATDVIDLPVNQWFWVKFFRIRSGTTGTPVNQGAARDLIVVCSARD
jgi:hypothetical protein